MRSKFLLILLFMVIIGSIDNLKADIFSYTTIISSYSDTNTVDAKNLAINQGRYNALLSVVKKITSKDMDEKILEVFKEDEAYLYEERFSISGETITKNFYTAKAFFQFDNERILEKLEESEINYLIRPLSSNIVIPVFRDKNGDISSLSAWDNIWININSDDFLSPIIYYKEDNLDFIEKKKELNDLKSSLEAKGVYQVVLVNDENMYSVEIINIFTKKSFLIGSFSSLQEAKDNTIRYIEEEQKKDFLKIYSGQSGETLFKVETTNFNNWVSIEKVLKENVAINEVMIVRIENNFVYIRINYKGNIKELAKTLQQECVHLNIYNFTINLENNCK